MSEHLIKLSYRMEQFDVMRLKLLHALESSRRGEVHSLGDLKDALGLAEWSLEKVL